MKLNQVYSEIVSPVNQLSNDVHETRNVSEEFLKSPDPSKFSADLKRAEEETNALAAHLISALNLSRCNDADKAAAVMEAVRFIGRSLAMNDEVPCSQATTICLATINFSYERPEWFSKKFAKTLAQRVQPKEVSEIVGHLNPNRNL